MVVQLWAHFSMVTIISRPTMLNFPPSLTLSCASLYIYLQGIYSAIVLPCHSHLWVQSFWNSTLSVLVLANPNNFDQEHFSTTLIPLPRPFMSWTAQALENLFEIVQQQCLSVSGTGSLLLTLYSLAFKVSVIHACLLIRLLFIKAFVEKL